MSPHHTIITEGCPMVFEEVLTNGASNNCLFNAANQGLFNYPKPPGLWQQPALSWRQEVLPNLEPDEAFGFANAKAQVEMVEMFQVFPAWIGGVGRR
jgi:hypothetical protein